MAVPKGVNLAKHIILYIFTFLSIAMGVYFLYNIFAQKKIDKTQNNILDYSKVISSTLFNIPSLAQGIIKIIQGPSGTSSIGQGAYDILGAFADAFMYGSNVISSYDSIADIISEKPATVQEKLINKGNFALLDTVVHNFAAFPQSQE